jgi:hypothetical protein
MRLLQSQRLHALKSDVKATNLVMKNLEGDRYGILEAAIPAFVEEAKKIFKNV